jgi:iron complex outermembrane recepter protein
MKYFNKLFLLALLWWAATAAVSAQKGTVTGMVKDADGSGLIGVTVQAPGLGSGTLTDANGTYRLSLPAGTHTLRFSYTGYASQSPSVTVKGGETTALNIELVDDALGLNEVVVLGTRASDRTVIKSPVPVDIITAKDIQATGATQTIQILQMLVPSFNASKPSIVDGSDHFRPATLRGLGPDQVLVLVNGKRRHTSALVHVNGTIGRGATGVDLNAIPAAAIDRIEVLRDGAAAQYGSDAIAGVINIVLRKDRGFDVMVNGGTHATNFERGYEATEGLSTRPDGTPVTNQDVIDAYGPFYEGWVNTTEKVFKTDGQRLNAHIGKGFAIGEDGTFYLSAQYRRQGRTSRQGTDARVNYFTQPDGSFDPREATFERNENFRLGDSQFDEVSAFFNGDIPFKNGVTLYTFGGVNHRNGVSGCFYRRARDNRNVRSIYPDGFLPLINARLTDLSASVGLKGQKGKWNWDLSEVVGRNAFALYMQNALNTSLGGLNQYQFPDGVSQKTDMYNGTLSFLQATTNLDLSRQFELGMARPLNLGLGAEFRYENYGIEPGEITSYYDGNAISGGIQDGPSVGGRAAAGCQCFPGWKDNVTQNRSNVGAYLDLETDPVKGWTTSVAGRYEYYNDFGSTLTGKVATRYEFTKNLAIRAAVSSGFRAPSLGQGNYSAIQTTSVGTQLVETGFFPVNTPIARALGATNLEAEKSLNLSGGITASFGKFSLTVDAYRIDITDRIILSEQFQGIESSGVNLLEQYLISQGVSAAQGAYFTNALDTRTQGLDITGRYGVNVGKGKLRFTLSANLNETKVTNKDEIQTPAVLRQYSETPLFSQIEITRLELANPRNVFNLIINYDVNRFSLFLRNVRFGETTWAEFNDFGDLVSQEYTPKIQTDLELGYKVTDKFVLTVGSNNLLDVYPDKQRKDLAFTGIFQYDGTNPLGFNGRYVYARANYRF